jgi:hypothetical protein
MRGALAVLAICVALAAPANAEVFKCVGPNGEIRFTSDAAKCPNAAPHAPKSAAVQRVDGAGPQLATARPGAPARPRTSAPAAHDESAMQEQAWRQKKSAAEQELRALEAALEHILAAVRWCNKGHGVTKENPRTGLREDVSCENVYDERDRLDGEVEAKRAYVATGLEEECRRTGCLPGWIR